MDKNLRWESSDGSAAQYKKFKKIVAWCIKKIWVCQPSGICLPPYMAIHVKQLKTQVLFVFIFICFDRRCCTVCTDFKKISGTTTIPGQEIIQ